MSTLLGLFGSFLSEHNPLGAALRILVTQSWRQHCEKGHVYRTVNKCSYPSQKKLDSSEDSLEMAKTLEVSSAICICTSSTFFFLIIPWI